MKTEQPMSGNLTPVVQRTDISPLLDTIVRTVAKIRELCRTANTDDEPARPALNESIRTQVAHLFEFELACAAYMRLGGDRPPAGCAIRSDPLPNLPLWQLVTAWEQLRATNLYMFAALSGNCTDGEPAGHPGSAGLIGLLHDVIEHDCRHLNHIETVVAALSAPDPGGFR
jgi:hypothetical protein